MAILETYKITEKVAGFASALGLLSALLIFCLTAIPSTAQGRKAGTLSGKKAVITPSAEYERDRAARRLATADDVPNYTRPAKLIEMSFRFAPGVSSNSAEGAGAYGQFRPNGIGVRLSLGPSLDYFFFKDRYAFSSGLWYTLRRSSFVVPGSFGEAVFRPGQSPGESVYNLQYLQVPLTVKMYANELGPSLRGYIQCGGLAGVKLAEKALYQTTNPLYRYATAGGSYQRQYGRFDLGMMLSAGIQYKINRINALNAGLSYQRGLVNVFRNNSLESRNNTVALELGFQF